MTKICTHCKIEKPITEFYHRKDRPGTVIANCKKCTVVNNRRYRDKEYRKEWAAKYYQKNKQKIGLKKYGLTIAQYDEKLQAQNGVCAICCQTVQGKRLFVDHNHSTGKVRGLLCSNCNFLIGQAAESKDILRHAVEYLSKYEEKT